MVADPRIITLADPKDDDDDVVDIFDDLREYAERLFQKCRGERHTAEGDQAWQARRRAYESLQQAEAHMLWLVAHERTDAKASAK